MPHVYCPGTRVGPQRPAEQQNVGLGLVDPEMLPAQTLLYTYGPPLFLGQQFIAAVSDLLEDFPGELDVTVFIIIVRILVAILNLVRVPHDGAGRDGIHNHRPHTCRYTQSR
eukprot:CAMPEP_0204313102 /NCGR_PEP_ID=MMETSP0469-20131031/3383_1 /ASSEMBLY_ACC=CAM_ASM_000384 /TAXON_ID=2969 /ORGANISM="Oxyrrhis marina" /LENGTH=111 /DNA_ID=CAMNT_0051293339 /DNA_START=91 /DNA_END=423 /DNA_ORIENTATION=-